MVTRTRHDVTFSVHCLPCSLFERSPEAQLYTVYDPLKTTANVSLKIHRIKIFTYCGLTSAKCNRLTFHFSAG
jgi:hypothetical protein